jgi:ferredoxin-thioredoxin reductase catalytic subunit
MAKTERNRNQTDGKYLHDNDRLCVCGHIHGQHTEIRGRFPDGRPCQPCLGDELKDDGNCDCEAFKPAKKNRAAS